MNGGELKFPEVMEKQEETCANLGYIGDEIKDRLEYGVH